MSQNDDQEIDGEKEFQWAFYLNRKYLDLIGVWPSDKKQSRFSSSWLPLVLMLDLSCAVYPTVSALIKVRHEIPLFLDTMLSVIGSSVAACKLLSFWYYRPVYQSLIKWARCDWHRHSEAWERQLMIKQARRGRFLTTFGCVTIFTHGVMLLMCPVIDLRIRIINNITDPNPQRVLPLPSYYPFRYYESPYYELAYLSQMIGVPVGVSAYSALDNFFGVLVFHASAQCEILTEKMCRLFDERGNPTFEDRAREMVEFHNRLVIFVGAIEKSFNFIILVHVTCSMLLVCNVSYGCIKSFDDPPPVVQLIVMAAAVLDLNEHMFVYCITSEILACNSSEIFDGIYNSLWYDMPAKKARYVILILARSQNPLRMSAGKFFNLNLNTYIQILKSTGGYISMLLAIS